MIYISAYSISVTSYVYVGIVFVVLHVVICILMFSCRCLSSQPQSLYRAAHTAGELPGHTVNRKNPRCLLKQISEIVLLNFNKHFLIPV